MAFFAKFFPSFFDLGPNGSPTGRSTFVSIAFWHSRPPHELGFGIRIGWILGGENAGKGFLAAAKHCEFAVQQILPKGGSFILDFDVI